jgi:hypothetical protein
MIKNIFTKSLIHPLSCNERVLSAEALNRAITRNNACHKRMKAGKACMKLTTKIFLKICSLLSESSSTGLPFIGSGRGDIKAVVTNMEVT